MQFRNESGLYWRLGDETTEPFLMMYHDSIHRFMNLLCVCHGGKGVGELFVVKSKLQDLDENYMGGGVGGVVTFFTNQVLDNFNLSLIQDPVFH